MDPTIIFITAARFVLQVATLILLARLIWRLRPKGTARCAAVAGITAVAFLLVMLLQYEVVSRQVSLANAILPLPVFQTLLVLVWTLIVAAVVLVGPIIDRMRRAEEKLIDQQQLLEQIQDLAPVGISMSDEEGRFVYVNRTFCEINARREADLIGQPFTTVVAPEWRQLAADFHRKFVAGEPVAPPPEQALAGADGVGRIVLLRHRRLIRRDGRRYRLATTIDITDRKAAEEAFRESEQRFRQFAEIVPHVVWMATPDLSRIVYINSAWERITGQPRRHALASSQNWLEMVHRDDIERVQAALPGLAGGNYDLEFRVVRPDGTVRWLHDVGIPIRNERGEVYLLAGISEDITERKLSAARIEEQTAHLAHVARLSTLGEMLAGIAHEVNQPLHAISNFAGACQRALNHREGTADDRVNEWIDQIAKSALRAGDIVRRLRSFARRGQSPRRAEAAGSIHEIIQEAAELAAIEARRHRAVIQFDLCPGDPAVQVDRVQIQQVLVNLLKNAFEALQDVSPDHRIVTVRTQAAGDQIQVSILDRGAGLSVADPSRLFEAFFTTKSDGMGMGLAVSRTIIVAHGGTLWATPNTDRGAAFHFTLLVARGVRHADDDPGQRHRLRS
jgi:two-component system sensor kinase FixL